MSRITEIFVKGFFLLVADMVSSRNPTNLVIAAKNRMEMLDLVFGRPRYQSQSEGRVKLMATGNFRFDGT